jgi:FkbM family methyltransferase
MLTSLVKKPLRLLGMDLVRYRPKYSLGGYAYLTGLNINTVLDVGAHAGEFARMIGTILPGVSVISFEPLKEEFQQLQRSFSKQPKFTAFNYAIGEKNGTVEMHRNEYSESSSLLPMAESHKRAFPNTRNESLETVELRRLDDVLSDLPLQEEILIKIDVQGYEDRVIKGAESLMRKARALIVEVSFEQLYEGQPLFDDVYAMLKARGFEYRGNLYQLLDPLDGRVLQADAFFVKRKNPQEVSHSPSTCTTT